MKKLLNIAFIATITLCMSVNVFAEEVNESTETNTVNTDITTSIAPTYTVTIPGNAVIECNALSTNLGSISLEAAQIDPNYVVTVSANTGLFSNKANEQKTIPYKLMVGTEEFTSSEYDTVGDSTALTIAIEKTAWQVASAGDYSGTITFTVTYGKKTK